MCRKRHPSSRISSVDPYLKPQFPVFSSDLTYTDRCISLGSASAPKSHLQTACTKLQQLEGEEPRTIARSNFEIVPIVPRTHLGPMIFSFILFVVSLPTMLSDVHLGSLLQILGKAIPQVLAF